MTSPSSPIPSASPVMPPEVREIEKRLTPGGKYDCEFAEQSGSRLLSIALSLVVDCDALLSAYKALAAERQDAHDEISRLIVETNRLNLELAKASPAALEGVEDVCRQIAVIIEDAMHGIEWTAGKRPSVEDLERILLSDNQPRINLLPDGSITAGEPRDAAYKAADAILTAFPALMGKATSPVRHSYRHAIDSLRNSGWKEAALFLEVNENRPAAPQAPAMTEEERPEGVLSAAQCREIERMYRHQVMERSEKIWTATITFLQNELDRLAPQDRDVAGEQEGERQG